MSERVYCELLVHLENGKFVLRDDRGLPVRGVRKLNITQAINEVTSLAVELVSRAHSLSPNQTRHLIEAINEEVRDGAKLDLK